MNDILFYFNIGWDHIMSWDALDHLLFLLALIAIYTFNNWKQVLILVTAFTIGHSLTLLLSVLDIIRFSNQWVEFLIPCTIVITALLNFTKKDRSKNLYINYSIAFLFGLIHGMGFANTIRFMLASDQQIGTGLVGFNIGLEAGQIVVVLLILLVEYLLVRYVKVSKRIWVFLLSAGTFAFALKMAIERLPI
jgi:hypothetical protein